jgi:hypothetical protein
MSNPLPEIKRLKLHITSSMRVVGGVVAVSAIDSLSGVAVFELEFTARQAAEVFLGQRSREIDAEIVVSPLHGKKRVAQRIVVPGLSRKTWDVRHSMVAGVMEDYPGWYADPYDLWTQFNQYRVSPEGYEILIVKYEDPA